MTPVPADPAAFVAEAERITNERDVDGAAAAYAEDARLETITDGAAESYGGREEIRRAWAGYLSAMEARGFVLRKRLVSVGGDTIVNEWEGTLGGRTHARGVEWWRFGDDERVIEHVLLSFLNVRPSSSPLARLRLASLYPATALSFLREQKRASR